MFLGFLSGTSIRQRLVKVTAPCKMVQTVDLAAFAFDPVPFQPPCPLSLPIFRADLSMNSFFLFFFFFSSAPRVGRVFLSMRRLDEEVKPSVSDQAPHFVVKSVKSVAAQSLKLGNLSTWAAPGFFGSCRTAPVLEQGLQQQGSEFDFICRGLPHRTTDLCSPPREMTKRRVFLFFIWLRDAFAISVSLRGKFPR